MRGEQKFPTLVAKVVACVEAKNAENLPKSCQELAKILLRSYQDLTKIPQDIA